MIRKILIAALLGLAAGAASADPFDDCRGGASPAPQGAVQDSLGLWSKTCGNFNFHAYDARRDDKKTPAQRTAAESYAYTITCGGDGFAAGYSGPGATSCVRRGETRNVGALHTVGTAIDHTQRGGTVYLPAGTYVDTGCGTTSDGASRAECPRPFLADRRQRTDWATTGPHALRARIVVDRGITLVGEGSPEVFQNDPGDSTVTKHRPKLVGTWILQDRGNAGEASSFGTSCTGSDCRTLDGPAQNLANTGYAVAVGGPDWSNGNNGYCDLDASGTCDEDQNSAEFFAPADFSPYGVSSSIIGTSTSESAGTMCIENTPAGTTDATYTGVCSLNPLVRCGAAGANTARASHGCGTVAADGFNYGTCQGPVTQMNDDLTAGKRIAMAFEVSQCADNPASNAECASDAGTATYIAEQRGAVGAGCNTTGVTLSIGTFGSSSTRSWPFPFGDFFPGGSGATNRVRFIDRDKFFAGGKITGVGFAPSNWVGRYASDTVAAGTSASSGTVQSITLDTFTAGSTPANDQWNGLSVIITEGSTTCYRTVVDTVAGAPATISFSDTGDTSDNCALSGAATWRVSRASCTSNGDTDNDDEDSACDTQTLVGFPNGAGGVVDGIRTWSASQAQALASAVDMRGSGLDRKILNSAFTDRRRGTMFDLCSAEFSGNEFANDAAQEAVLTGGTGVAFFCQNVRMFNNVFRSVGGGTSFLTIGNNSRNITIENNFGYNIRSSAFIYAGIANGLTIQKNYVVGLEAGTAVDLEIGAFGASTVVSKQIRIRDNVFTGAMSQDSGTGNPQTAILVRSYGGNTTRADDLQGLSITGNHVANDAVDQCVVWLEDDCAGSGTGGCTGADAAALVAEAWTEFDISGNSVTSDGSPRAVCIGAYRAAGGHLDATDSRDPLKERYAPRMVGNLANGVLEEGPLLNGQLAAQTPDCDATSACVAGTRVKILDDTAANACTDATADDQLDGGGSAVSECCYDGSAWASCI